MAAQLDEFSPRLKIPNANVAFEANAGIVDRGAASADGEAAALGTKRHAVSDPARSIEDLQPLSVAGIPNNDIAIGKSGGGPAAVGGNRNRGSRFTGPT